MPKFFTRDSWSSPKYLIGSYPKSVQSIVHCIYLWTNIVCGQRLDRFICYENPKIWHKYVKRQTYFTFLIHFWKVEIQFWHIFDSFQSLYLVGDKQKCDKNVSKVAKYSQQWISWFVSFLIHFGPKWFWKRLQQCNKNVSKDTLLSVFWYFFERPIDIF